MLPVRLDTGYFDAIVVVTFVETDGSVDEQGGIAGNQSCRSCPESVLRSCTGWRSGLVLTCLDTEVRAAVCVSTFPASHIALVLGKLTDLSVRKKSQDHKG